MTEKKRPPIGGISQYATIGAGKQEKKEEEVAPSHYHTSAIVRTKRGYALRDDLVKACKQIALDEDRTLYEVMEEALEKFLEQRRTFTQV